MSVCLLCFRVLCPGLSAGDKSVRQIQQSWQDKQYDDQRENSSPTDKDTQLGQQLIGRHVAKQQADDSQDTAGCQDGYGDIRDRAGNGFFPAPHT